MNFPKRPRIAYLIDSLQIGGTELNAVRLAEQLDRDRFDLLVGHIHAQGPLLERYHARGIRTEAFPFHGFFTPSFWRESWRLARWLRRERIDLLHTHDIYSNVFGVTTAKLAGTRSILASRRWWHNDLDPALVRLNAFSSRLAGQVVCNSPTISAVACAEYEIDTARVHFIPNFLELETFSKPDREQVLVLREALGIPADAIVLGVVARLAAIKNHELILKVLPLILSKHPNLFTVFVGNGPHRTSLEREARNLGLSGQVLFTGELPSRPNLHSLFDISLLTSRSEASPNSLLEAMAAGVPVIATRVGGIPDLIADKHTGLLIPSDDSDALAGALLHLLAHPGLCRAYGQCGRERARREFRSDVILTKITQLYDALVVDPNYLSEPVNVNETPALRI